MNNLSVVDAKILILKYGININFELFKEIDVNKYKMKKSIIKATRCGNLKVYDTSDDKNYIPSEILIEGNNYSSITKVRHNEKSLLSLKKCNDYYELFNDGNKIDVKIKLVEYEIILKEKIPNTQYEIGDYVGIVGKNRVTVLFFDGCYNWSIGRPCKFCDLHPKEIKCKVARPTLNELNEYNNEEEWWNSKKEEYLKNLVYSLKKVLDFLCDKELFLFFMAGNLSSSKMVWKIAIDTLKKIYEEGIDINRYENYLNIAPHDKINSLECVFKYGIKNVQYNIEVFGKKDFENYCPGKMQYEKFIEKFGQAVNLLGRGKVRSNIVLGLQEIEETINGVEEFAKMGIVCDYSVFQPKKGTALEKKEAPQFEYVEKFTHDLIEIYKKYDMKPIFSSLSSRSSIVNEIYDNYGEK